MAFDTKTITLHQNEMPFLGEIDFNMSENHVIDAVKLAFDDTELGKQTGFKNFGVAEIVKGNAHSKAAYIESDKGYFVISESMMSHVIVTYSRWD